MKWLLMAGSLSSKSVNRQLIENAQICAQDLGVETILKPFSEYDLPLYNADIEEKAIPENAEKFAKDLASVDALVLSSPEYNYSVPGTVKNLVDWISRVKPLPWKNKQILLMSASPGLVGGNRGLWQLRISLEGCKAFVYPSMFSLPNAYEAFEERKLKDSKTEQRLQNLLKEFKEHLESIKH